MSSFALLATSLTAPAPPALPNPDLPTLTLQASEPGPPPYEPQLDLAYTRYRRASIGSYLTVGGIAGFFVLPIGGLVVTGVCGILTQDLEGCALPVVTATAFTMLGSAAVGFGGAVTMWVAAPRAELALRDVGRPYRRLGWAPAVIGLSSVPLFALAIANPELGPRTTFGVAGGALFVTGGLLGLVQVGRLRGELPRRVSVLPTGRGLKLVARL